VGPAPVIEGAMPPARRRRGRGAGPQLLSRRAWRVTASRHRDGGCARDMPGEELLSKSRRGETTSGRSGLCPRRRAPLPADAAGAAR